MSNQKVIIVGAGLAGSLLAIYLARRGFAVEVFEARGDMRGEETVAGRSINLALSDRGIAALREVGMDRYMLSEAVPMRGRMVHTLTGATKLLPYSGREGEYINSVSRSGLNIALMNEAEQHENVRFHFHRRCIDLDRESGEAIFSDGTRATGDTVIATDGAGSAVRHAMMQGGIDRFDFSQKWLEHGYKELHIPPSSGGGFLLEKNALHIWPRHKFMMIALPNFDGSFTCTLFLDHTGGDASVSERGEQGLAATPASPNGSPATLPNGRVSARYPGNSFEQLSDEDAVLWFFEREFSDAAPIMPTLVDDFFENPTGNLGTVKCFPWNVGGKALLLGDSAHAIVPFYGQGMNCAFEDVRVLDGLIEKHGADWETVYAAYSAERKPNTDAIADMAEENFYEMRDAVADPVFQRKRDLETRLEHAYTDYYSKYSMVTFREDLPYKVAKDKGNAQDRFLMSIVGTRENIEAIDLDETMDAIRLI